MEGCSILTTVQPMPSVQPRINGDGRRQLGWGRVPQDDLERVCRELLCTHRLQSVSGSMVLLRKFYVR